MTRPIGSRNRNIVAVNMGDYWWPARNPTLRAKPPEHDAEPLSLNARYDLWRVRMGKVAT